MNRLSREQSPYLRQHAANPVDWYPWGPEAFAKAAAENKPVLLSVGYSTCHWCHVMAHESFEDPGIAQIMNEHFVSIKVDREERPDVDQIYMTAVTAMTGQGGWPLTVFLTPDQKPFYGGTYFPPRGRWGMPGFTDVLTSIATAWRDKREQVVTSGQALTELLGQSTAGGEDAGMPDGTTLQKAFGELKGMFDAKFGGFGQAPKFPMAHTLSFLLRIWKRTGDGAALTMVDQTLAAMARGGIYDHLGGGFHRYATDQRWHVPHFEKMLYDQALLVLAYLDGFQATGQEAYGRVAGEILDYCLRDLRDPGGAFYSAEDADSPDWRLPPESRHNAEGAFYLWTTEEIGQCLSPEEAGVVCYHFGAEPGGNAASDPQGEFTGKNILYQAHTVEETAAQARKSPDDVRRILQKARETMFQTRARRPRPHRDEKIMTDWNGLMISALSRAGRLLNDVRYVNAARETAGFILQRLRRPDGRLWHRYCDGDARILGMLDDYAFLIQGLLDLYETTFEEIYGTTAVELAGQMLELFWDKDRGGCYMTGADAETLIHRPKDIYDGALPSGNSTAAMILVRLSHVTAEAVWQEKAEGLLRAFAPFLIQRPSAGVVALGAADFILGPVQQVILAARKGDPGLAPFLAALNKSFVPNRIIMLNLIDPSKSAGMSRHLQEYGVLDGRVTAYVCQNRSCRQPTSDVGQFVQQLST